jgi:hypothetical protein
MQLLYQPHSVAIRYCARRDSWVALDSALSSPDLWQIARQAGALNRLAPVTTAPDPAAILPPAFRGQPQLAAPAWKAPAKQRPAPPAAVAGHLGIESVLTILGPLAHISNMHQAREWLAASPIPMLGMAATPFKGDPQVGDPRGQQHVRASASEAGRRR